jgi:nitrilase
MIRVAAIQIAPVFLNKEETWKKLESYIREAQGEGAELITWRETLIPGYPFWLSPSGGAPTNKSFQVPACFVVRIEDGEISEIYEYLDRLEFSAQLGNAR